MTALEEHRGRDIAMGALQHRKEVPLTDVHASAVRTSEEYAATVYNTATRDDATILEFSTRPFGLVSHNIIQHPG